MVEKQNKSKLKLIWHAKVNSHNEKWKSYIAFKSKEIAKIVRTEDWKSKLLGRQVEGKIVENGRTHRKERDNEVKARLIETNELLH